VAARAACDSARVAELLADELEWTTPRGRTYDKETILPHLVEDEGDEWVRVSRENYRFEPLGAGRVLALFEQVYAWVDGSGLVNRVPAGAIFELRDGTIVRAQYFLNADKARVAV
jgi:hypothetical protein